MKLCANHWALLRAACTSRGMDHLLHRDGESALDAITRELQGNCDLSNFDPLLAATWMIYSRALQQGGVYLMAASANGQDHCPTCEAIKHMGATYDRTDYPTMESHWTDGVMDAVLDEARTRGLMPKPA